LRHLPFLARPDEPDRGDDLAALVMSVERERPARDRVSVVRETDAILEDLAQLVEFGHDGWARAEVGDSVLGGAQHAAVVELEVEHVPASAVVIADGGRRPGGGSQGLGVTAQARRLVDV
jgi:hypothetical protein